MFAPPPHKHATYRNRHIASCGRRFILSGLITLIAVGFFAGGGGSGAFEQAVPPSAEPGRIEPRFQAEPRPQSKPEVSFPAPEQAPAPDRAAAIRFTLTQLRIEGATVYSETGLFPFCQYLPDREFSLADLYAVRDIIIPQIEKPRSRDLSHAKAADPKGTALTLGLRRNCSDPGDGITTTDKLKIV